MAILDSGWVSIVGGTDTGLQVEAKLDTAFGNIDTFMTETIEKTPFVPTYDYDTASNVTVTNDVYQEVARLTTPSRPAGTYEVKLSMLYSLNSTTTSAYFRFSLDGGVSWTEVIEEPKDITDNRAKTLLLVDIHTLGIKDIVVQARKEVAGDVMTISNLSVIYERKV